MSITQNETQHAVLVSEIGQPVVLGTREIPVPGEDEVLVKVTATQVLPHDTYSRDFGLFIKENLPYVLGSNIAGIVQSLGPKETKYHLGQHIYGGGRPLDPVPNFAGLQQYALLKVSNSAPVPTGLSDDQAATLPTNAVTGVAGLFHEKWLNIPPPFTPQAKSHDYSNEKLVILGAGSNAGRLAVQFASIAGVGLIVAVASLLGEEDLKAMGATHVIDRHLSSTKIAEEVWKIFGGQEEVTKIYDAANVDYALDIELVARHKKSVIAGLRSSRAAAAQPLLKEQGKNMAELKPVAGAINHWSKADTALFWEWLEKGLKEGKVWVPEYQIVEGLDVGKINEVLDSYRDGNRVLQAVVHPGGKIAAS